MQACLYLYMLIMGSFYLEMINEGKKMLAEISTQLNCVQQPSVLSALASLLVGSCWHKGILKRAGLWVSGKSGV